MNTISNDMFAIILKDNTEDFQTMHMVSQCDKRLAAIMKPRLERMRTQLGLCFDFKSEVYAFMARKIPRLSPLHNTSSKWAIRGFVLPGERDLDYNNGDVEVQVDYQRVKACQKHLFVVTVDATHMHNGGDNIKLEVQPYTATTGVFKRNRQGWMGYRGGLINHLAMSD